MSESLPDDAAKDTLHRYLRAQRDALRAKVEGVGEYDARRPLTGTGTNLLGLVKHVASVQAEYLGLVFDRPFDAAAAGAPWLLTGEQGDDDLWLAEDETAEQVWAVWDASDAHADATVDALGLDAVGHVPWWGPEPVTLHQVLVHLTVEVARHAGHADILREQLDGAVGLAPEWSNLPDRDADAWAARSARIEAAARAYR